MFRFRSGTAKSLPKLPKFVIAIIDANKVEHTGLLVVLETVFIISSVVKGQIQQAPG